ncbi:unnamed protein product [Adineta ricciae]|uniref:EamA domain-containing protein n=1 Tax=Adineta ricciae TaxID=249248 RepID=A0A813Z2E2_ADIRI|nr:unnamed protein product [Adineta ricciae]CAF0892336.1 unnamed protein product [Adineta ricciae]
MNPSVAANSRGEKPDEISTVDSISKSDVDIADSIPTIIIESSSNGNNSPVTPSSPTDKKQTDESGFISPSQTPQQEATYSASLKTADSTTATTTQRNSQLLDELKYLLKPTNSLANPDSPIQATQEADVAIKRRTLQFDEDVLKETDRLLIEGLTPIEAKSLGAVERRSIASRGGHRVSYIDAVSNRSRASSVQPTSYTGYYAQPTTIDLVHEPKSHRTLFDRLSDLMWICFAAYSFSIILFLTDKCGIDLIFGFSLQMIIQTVAFGIYAFYKGYSLFEPFEYRTAMIARSVFIGIGVLTAYLAYYYITLPNLSAFRQTQVILTVLLSLIILREGITIPRILALVLTSIAVIVLTRPTKFGEAPTTEYNTNNYKNSWIPYSSSWNYIIGISLALCTAILHSIASVINKVYLTTQHIHDTVVCFWSALSALLISIALLWVTHFMIKDVRSFPHDWRLYAAFGLALLSIFAFVANQKAVKRAYSSTVTLIYSTDIILVLILQNLFTQFKSDAVIILGCVLVFTSALIICMEMLIMEKSRSTTLVKLAEVANTSTQHVDSPNPAILDTSQKHISV